MFWMVEGALFAEVGNVWKKKEIDLGALAADWGFGIRVNMDFLLLRVDMGLRLRDPSLESKWLDPLTALRTRGFGIHFGVGYPF